MARRSEEEVGALGRDFQRPASRPQAEYDEERSRNRIAGFRHLPGFLIEGEERGLIKIIRTLPFATSNTAASRPNAASSNDPGGIIPSLRRPVR